MADADWDSKTVIGNRGGRGPTVARSESTLNDARRAGADVETSKKTTSAANAAHKSTEFAKIAKLDRDNEVAPPATVDRDLGRIISQARQALGLSQKDLAQKINEKPTVIAEYESGKAIPKQDLLGKMERILKVKLRGKNIGEPLGGSGDKKKCMSSQIGSGDCAQAGICLQRHAGISSLCPVPPYLHENHWIASQTIMTADLYWPLLYLRKHVLRPLLVLLRLGSRVSVVYAAKTAEISTGITLGQILESCSYLTGDKAFYMPPLHLLSGHAATIWAAVMDFSKINNIEYERHYLRLPDDGTIGLDFAPGFIAMPADETPLLICIHGLTGGSHESYVRAMLARATKSKAQGGCGWRSLVINYRGCSGTPVTSPRFYHGGWTHDMRCALLYVQSILPRAPLVAVGFSLGANVLTKYLGEEGDKTPICAACVLSNPWDFWAGHVVLESSSMGRLYSRAMASNLRRVLALHKHRFRDEDHPGLYLACVYSNPFQTLYEFDSGVTRILGGFASAEEYYTTQSSNRFLSGLRRPVLGFNATNDPVTSFTCVPFDEARHNPYLAMAYTMHGGHLGWFDALSPKQRWIVKPACEFLSAILAVHPMCAVPRRPTVQRNRKVFDAERPEVGFELLQEGVEITTEDALPEDTVEIQGGLKGL